MIGYDDHEEVADDHIDDSAHVYAGSEEGWDTNDGKWCGEEAEMVAEMREKTNVDSVRSIATQTPISITHSPHEETEPLHCEPSHGYVCGRGDKEDGETHCFGDTVGCQEGDEGGELFRGEFFSRDVTEVLWLRFTTEFARIHLFIGKGYSDCGG